MNKFVFLISGFFLLAFSLFLFRLVPDYLWFDSLGKVSVWALTLKAQWGFFLVGFLVAGAWLISQVLIANYFLKRHANESFGEFKTQSGVLNQLLNGMLQYSKQTFGPIIGKTLDVIVIVASLGLSGLMALTLSANWTTILLAFHRVSYGQSDPIFSKDISFYLFSLPAMDFLYGWILALMVVSLLVVFFVYFSKKLFFMLFGVRKDTRFLRWHFGSILTLLCGWMALGAWLDRFDILYSKSGVVFGAGYTDHHVFLPYKQVMVALWLIEAAVILYWVMKDRFRPAFLGFLGIVVVGVVGGNFLPQAIQAYTVAPNELGMERPYIAHAIHLTREAYGLDHIQSKQFPVSNTLNKASIERNEDVLRNIRLWDEEPLQKTFGQLQEIRQYYEFKKIDVDRYVVNGEIRQVLLSPREMEVDQLSGQAQTWMNMHLVYTHGYGLCMSPVNEITKEGLPKFYIKDIPPISDANFKVTRPEIYFGEGTDEYALVNTKQPEFDYPKGDKNVYTSYQGKGGVSLDSFWKRLTYAIQLSDVKLIISSLITNKTRIMYDRNIAVMVRKVAPFLLFDKDPYLVLSPEGRMIWVLDAYTVSSYFPYSEPYSRDINYIRHSVKVTIDAYDGDMKFYMIDSKDPLVQAYRSLFKGLFLSVSQMPDFLLDHWRYPKDYFIVQSDMFCTYHMTDPQVFYNKEDLWAFPTKSQPYYMVTKLPGSQSPEFVLAVPFTPANKNNMVAWLSVVCDQKRYGEKLVFKFPKEKTVYGPAQIESRIDQDTEISQKLTLWGQVGSSVIRGDLMVIPIEDSLVYVEPIYLQANQSQLPELKRVIFSYNDRVVMAEDLYSAISGCFDTTITEKSTSVTTVSSTTDNQMLRAIRDRYLKLREHISNELNFIDKALQKGGSQ